MPNRPPRRAPRGRSLVVTGAAIAVAALPWTASATQYFWDQDGDTSNKTGSIDATGIWDASALAWRSGSATGTPLVAWPNITPSADEAVFGTTNGGVASTVSLGADTINVNKITFTTTGYTLAGPASGTATLNLSGTSPVIDPTTVAATISAKLTGTSGFTRPNAATTADLILAGDNSGLSGTVTLNGGRMLINQGASGSAAAAWNLNAASVQVVYNSQTGTNNQTVNLGALSGVTGSILRNGGNVSGTTTFQVGALNTDTTFAGNLNTGPANFITAVKKVGTGTLTMSGAGTATGTITLQAGTIALGSNSGASSGPLGVGTVDLNGSGITIRAADATARSIANPVTISTSLTFGSATTGDLTFTGAINSGTVAKTLTVNNAVTTFAGAVASSGSTTTNANTKAGPGVLVLSNDANPMIKPLIISAGTVRLAPSTGTNNIAGVQSVSVAAGATFDVSTVAAGFALASGQVLRGNGSVLGATTVASGSSVSGGIGGATAGGGTGLLTTGAQTWAGGGRYVWDVNNATGAAGSTTSGWDKLNLGALAVTADGTTPFVVDVTSLTAAQAAGQAQNFNNAVNQSWVIATATGITGTVGPANVVVSTTNFQNDLGGGSFAVGTSGNDVVLTFTAVPEPTAAAAMGLAAAGLLGRRRRRRA